MRPRSRASRGALALASGLLGALALSACGRREPERFNLLLISLDSTRRDLLGAYGYRAPHAPAAQSSPNLDALAAGGVLMEEAYATTSWTFPSHVSLFSGQPELVHAVDVDFHRLDAARPTLAEILQAAGYRTAGFFSGPYLEAQFGFARGFERYEACYGPRLSEASAKSLQAAERLDQAERGGPADELRAAREADALAKQSIDFESHRDVSALAVSEAVLSELHRASAAEQPFFVFAHFFDPHYDYVPPDPFGATFDPDYRGALDGRDFYTSPAISTPDPERPGARVRTVGARDLEHVQSLYAAELAWTDAQIGTILAELKRLGLAERTLVVVLADHGDEFFEHGGIGHRTTLFEELVRIPLILRLPGELPRGARVRGLVSTVDVLPTVLELLEVPAPEGLASPGFLDLVRGAGDGAERAVLGRLVTSHRTTLAGAGDDPERELEVLHVTLLESYRQGPLKLVRERSWLRPLSAASPGATRRLVEESRRLREVETLRWIDLERFPDEREEEYSSDFDDPRARTALQAFHDLYAALLTQRGAAELSAEGDGHVAALQGLGYAGGLDRGAALASDEFTLPPPGAALLGEVPR